jgi:cytochrome c oxidase subunit 2
MSDSAFTSWYSDTTQVAAIDIESPTATGKRIMQNIGCFACHTIDGTKMVGPSFKGVWGSTKIVKSGKEEREIVVDEAYVKQSIYDPNADVVDGYNKGLMLSYESQLSDDDIGLIIEYLKTIK